MDTKEPKLLPLYAMARRLHVPNNWLRAEAEAGRIPCLIAGRQILFNPAIVESLIVERASGREGKNAR
jgi:hypothetical protein